MLPAGLLVKVLSNPGEGLHRHQAGHVHLLHVVRGGQHYLVGVGLDGGKQPEVKRATRQGRTQLILWFCDMRGQDNPTLFMANAMMMSDSL